MEAKEKDTPVIYNRETETYSGVFTAKVVDKFINEGALELVSNEQGVTTIILNGRDDFLSSFSAGANEASLGRDQYYADYNANPFAFSVGFETFLTIKKKKMLSVDYVCHGIEIDGKTHYQ